MTNTTDAIASLLVEIIIQKKREIFVPRASGQKENISVAESKIEK